MDLLMTYLLALLLLQDPAPPRPPFRATMTLERYGKREDRVSVESGELFVRPGDALLYRSGGLRLLIRGGRALERRAGERTSKAWDPAKPENFRPLDLWRLDPRTIREMFREVDDPVAADRRMPPAVVTANGTAVPPAPASPSPESLAWTDGVDRAEGCRRVILVPRDPELRSRVSSIRLSVDRATGRLLRAVVDSPAQLLTLTLGDFREDPSMDDAVFDWDRSTLKVEDR
jgi:hypothetical protein